MFSFDIGHLAESLEERVVVASATQVPLRENSHKFIKLAFDLWKAPIDNSIWEVSSIDGKEYLVRKTDGLEVKSNEDSKISEASSGAWTLRKETNNEISINLFNEPITKIKLPAGCSATEDFRIASEVIFDSLKRLDFKTNIMKNASLSTKGRVLAKCAKTPDSPFAKETFAFVASTIQREK